MLIKTVIILMLIMIIASLFSALTFIYKDKGSSEKTAKALTIRITLSIVLFSFLMLGFYFGIIPERGI